MSTGSAEREVGLALVYSNNLKVRHLEDANWMSFEYAIWRLEHKGPR